MPSRGGQAPSPLAGLPRPLDERDRSSRLGRRALSAGLLVGVAAVIAYATLGSGGSGPFGGVGAVAGAVPSPSPIATGLAAAAVPSTAPRPVEGDGPAATSAPAATPPPTPTPVPTPAPVDTLTGYRWPLPRGRVTLPFGPTPWGSRVVEGNLFHDGMDLATFCGDHVVAAHDGVVLAAGRHYDELMGWVGDLQPYLDRLKKKKLYPTLPIIVVIDDGNGYRSVYAHFSKVAVKKGQTIKAGAFLGYEGMTGRASGCHLHYGLFSPLETATFGMDPKVAKHMKLPLAEIARVDPLLVLPERPKPTKAPSTKPTPKPTPP